ncbi:MAG: hypothetical protein HY619_05060 [Thaumarchaeota archaeon]|nr:hypothetical protein [Nitrososphaerota archaeon]
MTSEEITAKAEELKRRVDEGAATFYKHYQELKEELHKCNENLRSAESILCSVIDCGTSDLGCIYDMEENHNGTIDRAVELREELGSINFGNFATAVKEKALEEVDEEVSNKDKESFQDMLIDDNYIAWGSIAAYGDYQGEDIESNHRRQELFADFVNGNLSKEKFLKAYNEELVKKE